jgi:epoxyqueuosine reductase
MLRPVVHLTVKDILQLAHESGFELAGVTTAGIPAQDYSRYRAWVDNGHAGRMTYLTDHRAEIRADPRQLLPNAASVLVVGKLYNTQRTDTSPDQGRISRYALGQDYHYTIRRDLEQFITRLKSIHNELFEYRICVDTAPLLERTLAREAGLGWIGKNTCLINQQQGSWFFLAEVLLTIEFADDAMGSPPADRCGSCTRCIDACPTTAIVPHESGDGTWKLDATQCISYFTIELKGSIPAEKRSQIGNLVFGCDICQDVCPWNRRSPVTAAPEFQATPDRTSPDLATLANLTREDFRLSWQGSPVSRTRHAGFLRNVAIAMGNSGAEKFREPLQRLAESSEDMVREHAIWALQKLG